MTLTPKQRSALEFLSWKYANAGPFYTASNQKFLHLHIHGQHDDAMIWVNQTSPRCHEAFDRIVAEDYSELTEKQRKQLDDQEHWRGVIGDEA